MASDGLLWALPRRNADHRAELAAARARYRQRTWHAATEVRVHPADVPAWPAELRGGLVPDPRVLRGCVFLVRGEG